MLPTREPLSATAEPLSASGFEQVTFDNASVEDCEHDAIPPTDSVSDDVPEAPVKGKATINVRLDRDTCRKLRITAAIQDVSQSEVIERALVEHFSIDTMPCPYLPLDLMDAEKVRRTFYITLDTYRLLNGRARLEMHSLDAVIYRSILDAVKLPEGLE